MSGNQVKASSYTLYHNKFHQDWKVCWHPDGGGNSQTAGHFYLECGLLIILLCEVFINHKYLTEDDKTKKSLTFRSYSDHIRMKIKLNIAKLIKLDFNISAACLP